MSWINWRIGLAFSLVLTLNFIIGFILKQFDLTETLHSIIIYGLIFFVVAGFMGNFLWKYRWFKVLSITIAIDPT